MSQIADTLEHLFRRESGRIVAHLTRYFGPRHLDLAENVVQEALLRAVQSWPIDGVPDNPAAWILTVARNRARDLVRQGAVVDFDSGRIDELGEQLSGRSEPEAVFDTELRDDQLKLMFVCCHPILSPEARVALTLKTVCGLNVAEIARAFLSKEETIAQRLVRAKLKIQEARLRYEVPAPDELDARLDSVLSVIYLVFNEGYAATQGESLIRTELAFEAIWLAQALAEHPLCGRPRVFALLALMQLQSSRFNSRADSRGELLLLEEQDRDQWDRGLIESGLRWLELAAQGEDLSDYHLQAGIAATHAVAPSFAATDWQRILAYYDLLLERIASPVVALNRAVALAMLRGPAAGLAEIAKLELEPALERYYLLPAASAELYRRAGDRARAREYYARALERVRTDAERRLINRRVLSMSDA